MMCLKRGLEFETDICRVKEMCGCLLLKEGLWKGGAVTSPVF